MNIPKLSVVFIFILLTFPRLSHSDILSEAKSTVEKSEKFVGKIASRAADLHSDREKIVRSCACSRHACFKDFSKSTCFADVVSQNDTVKVGRDVDYASNTFRLPPGADLDNLSGELKESICVFQYLEDLANDNDNEHGWVFIGKHRM